MSEINNDAKVVVLKHLARKYKADPYSMRRLLRLNYGKQGPWKWAEGSDALKAVEKLLEKAYGKNTSSSQEPSPPMPSPTVPKTETQSKTPKRVASTKKKSQN